MTWLFIAARPARVGLSGVRPAAKSILSWVGMESIPAPTLWSKGKLMPKGIYHRLITCQKCGHQFGNQIDNCPNCGAKSRTQRGYKYRSPREPIGAEASEVPLNKRGQPYQPAPYTP